jgi:hypothetical protein
MDQTDAVVLQSLHSMFCWYLEVHADLYLMFCLMLCLSARSILLFFDENTGMHNPVDQLLAPGSARSSLAHDAAGLGLVEADFVQRLISVRV